MEVVYFVISFIEIILTVYLVLLLIKGNKAIEKTLLQTEKILPLFNIVKKTLKVTSILSIYTKKSSEFSEYLKPINSILKVFSFMHFISYRFKIFPSFIKFEEKILRYFPFYKIKDRIKKTFVVWFT